jgi:hypothetical protein
MTVFGNLDKESWDTYLRSANRRSAWMVSKELFVVSEIYKCTINVHNYLDHIPLLKTLDQSDRSNAAENLFKKNVFKKKKKQNSLWPKKKGKAFGEGGEVLIMQKPKLPPPMFNNGRETE